MISNVRQKNRVNKITKYIIIVPVVSIILLSSLILFIVINAQENYLQEDLEQTKLIYFKYNKEIIVNQVNQAGIYISDIDKILNKRKNHINEHYKHENELMLIIIICISILVLLVTLLLSKKIASSLNFTNELLEQKVNEQTSKLQMLVANKTIENIEQTKSFEQQQLKNVKFTAIGQLAAGITHEINTPLTYIKGNFEMMRYDMEDLPIGAIRTRLLEDSEGITDGINRLANIVDSMREMSQKTKEAKEETNIYHTLITSLTLLHNRSKQISNIKINGEDFNLGLDKHKYSYTSCIQKQRVEQVWVIIINNALDELVKVNIFENRLIDISIECNENGDIVVKIRDNAGGIPNDVIENIFEPFVSTKESGGMGVGLNVAQKIMHEQDGEIVAYNENNGAVFEIIMNCRSCGTEW